MSRNFDHYNFSDRRAADAQQYAPDACRRQRISLARAQDYYRRKQGDKAIGTVARGAAEGAHFLTIRRKQEEAH